jgi:hypothetical protein
MLDFVCPRRDFEQDFEQDNSAKVCDLLDFDVSEDIFFTKRKLLLADVDSFDDLVDSVFSEEGASDDLDWTPPPNFPCNSLLGFRELKRSPLHDISNIACDVAQKSTNGPHGDLSEIGNTILFFIFSIGINLFLLLL